MSAGDEEASSTFHFRVSKHWKTYYVPGRITARILLSPHGIYSYFRFYATEIEAQRGQLNLTKVHSWQTQLKFRSWSD